MSGGASPRLSVVVPTHDTRELTLACLRALDASRDAGPMEVVVVDDASQDGTVAAVTAAHPCTRLVRLDTNVGFTAAILAGVPAASGEILVLLNSDTEVAPDALARLAAALDADPTLGAAGAALVHPDGEPQWSAGREPSLAWLFALSSGLTTLARRIPGYDRWRARSRGEARGAACAPVRVDWVPGAAVAIRRRAWDLVGGFDPRFALYAQDLDLCVRLRRAGWGVALVGSARVVHHLGSTIGAKPGAKPGGAHTALLWTDLVRWTCKARGVGRARAAKGVLLAGAWVRLALAFLGLVRRDERDVRAHHAAIGALVAFDLSSDALPR